MSIWVTSDTHWWHSNIVKYEDRPENHNELMIKNWNSLVQWNDLVIHLGDFLFGNSPSVIQTLSGNIALVRGNHDRHSIDWYLRNGIKFICDEFRLKMYGKNMIFSHIPIGNLSKEIDLNIHGHFHRMNHRDIEGIPDYKECGKYKLFTIEEENYSPVLLEEFVNRK